jgi:pyruvate/2-oxoglutarate dehydrogenase complex dihydrolipoamide dehydrogenase (E3) component
VIGGGALGCELALALANANNKVTVLEALEQAARGIEPISRFDLLEKVGAESRIDLLTNTKVRWVDGTKILYEIKEGRDTLLNVDFIVWATGYRPRRLQDLPIEDFPELEIRLIGDCLRPRNIFHAVRDGFWLGVKV